LPLVVLAATLSAAATASAQPLPSDPVEQLREALRKGADWGTSDVVRAARENNVIRRAEALNRLTDMGRALLLEEWRDEGLWRDDFPVDRQMREKLATRFRTGVQDMLRQSDAVRREAAANLVAEFVANARATRHLNELEWRMLIVVAPDLAQATADPDPLVRAAAAVALSKIVDRENPKVRQVALKLAVPAYKKMLAMLDAASRRAAAAALGEVLRILNDPDWPWTRNQAFVDLIQLSEAVVPILARSLRDADPEVRRHSLDALRQVALGLAALLDDRQFEGAHAYLMPLAKALRDPVPAVATALDDEATVIPACAVLEAIADARRHLVRQAAALALEEKQGNDKADPKITDVLGPELRRTSAALTKPLASKDVRTRLAALYALETFDEAAAPAAAALVKALADADPLVRWGAARALGRMASPQGTPAAAQAKAFPELARRLGDDSEEVRVTAAAALVRYGPRARTAGPEAVRFVNAGDAETRVLAIQVLGAVKADEQLAIPALTKALGAKEAPVRLAAVRALAVRGDAALASDKLRELMLRDPDAAVRRAAGAAFLNADLAAAAPAEEAEPIAPGSGLDGPLDARELARAMFDASQSNLKENVRQQLAIDRHFYQEEVELIRRGSVYRFNDLIELSRRWRAAELALCELPAERVATYLRPWQDAWKIERMAQALLEDGRMRSDDFDTGRYERLTAEMEWVRAGAGKALTRPLAETYPGLPPFEVPLSGKMDTHAEWVRAQFDASSADLGELAQQRVEAIRAVYRTRLKLYLHDRMPLDSMLDSAALLTDAELAVPDDKADAAAIRERAWERAWMADEINRRNVKAYFRNNWVLLMAIAPELFAESRYALLQAEIALLRAGQTRRPSRFGTLLNEPDLAKFFEAKEMAKARAAVGRTSLDGLLRQRLETAREGHRAAWQTFLHPKFAKGAKETLGVRILLGWPGRVLESELALANGPAGREAALARHWKRVWQAEAAVLHRFEHWGGRVPIESVMRLRSARLEAERLWAPWQGRK
jgi:HEAT repeat protein